MNPKMNRNSAGFTLIELMISMSVTLVLLYAAVSMFRNASQSNQVVTQASDMTDNLRAGLNLIQQDLQQAGTGIPTGGIPIPYTSNGSTTSPCGLTPEPKRPTLTGNALFTPCNATLPAVEPGNALGPMVTAPDSTTARPTDEITMLYADNTLGMDAKPINQPANPGPPAQPACNGTLTISGTTLIVLFDTSANCAPLAQPGVKLNAGDLVMFSNTKGSTIMYVTSATATTATFGPGDPFNLNARSTDTGGTIWQLQIVHSLRRSSGLLSSYHRNAHLDDFLLPGQYNQPALRPFDSPGKFQPTDTGRRDIGEPAIHLQLCGWRNEPSEPGSDPGREQRIADSFCQRSTRRPFHLSHQTGFYTDVCPKQFGNPDQSSQHGVLQQVSVNRSMQ